MMRFASVRQVLAQNTDDQAAQDLWTTGSWVEYGTLLVPVLAVEFSIKQHTNWLCREANSFLTVIFIETRLNNSQ